MNIDYNSLWFETRNDTLKAITCYFNLIYNLNLKFSEKDVLNLSGDIGKIHHKRLLPKYLRSYLRQRGVMTDNSFLLKLINYPAQAYLSLLYFKELNKTFNVRKPGVLFSITDPGIKLYLTMILCIFSINSDGVNKSLLEKAYLKLGRFFPVKRLNKYKASPFLDWKIYAVFIQRLSEFINF